MPKMLTSDELDLALATDWSAVHEHCEALRLRAEDACARAVSLQADLDAAQVRIAELKAALRHAKAALEEVEPQAKGALVRASLLQATKRAAEALGNYDTW